MKTSSEIIEFLRSGEIQLVVGSFISIASALIVALTLYYIRRINAHSHRMDKLFSDELNTWVDEARAEFKKRSKAR